LPLPFALETPLASAFLSERFVGFENLIAIIFFPCFNIPKYTINLFFSTACIRKS
jgi:hypothetical protein